MQKIQLKSYFPLRDTYFAKWDFAKVKGHCKSEQENVKNIRI
jgi:hypothetical protein